MSEIRNFISKYDLGVKGRSKQKIINRLKKKLTPKDCEVLVNKFKGKTDRNRANHSLERQTEVNLPIIETKLRKLQNLFEKIESDFK